MERRQRKRNRLEGYDYGRAGYYFITICAKNKQPLFRKEPVGADIIRPRPPYLPPLSPCGEIVERAIQNIPAHYRGVSVDKYVIMPNHVHMILTIVLENGRMISAPTKPVPGIIGQMKRYVSKCAGSEIWQKSYHDHIIRSRADYLRIWEYMDGNPAKWREDCYYTGSVEE